MDLALPAAAALWGAAAGTLLPRAAYRFSAPAGEQWRTTCPADHPLRGWLGRAHCTECTTPEGAQNSPLTPAHAPDPTPAPDKHPTPAPADSPTPGAHPTGTALTDGPTPAHADRGAPGAHPTAPAPNDNLAPAPDGGSAPGARPIQPAPGDGPVPGAHSTPPAPGEHRTPPARPRAAYGPRTTPLAVATALVCAALALATGTRPDLAVWLVLAPVGVLLAVVDFRVQRLPDPLTLPLAAAALALLGGAALLPEHAGDWLTALYAALALGGAYFVLFLINPGGMGFGDVKLALGMGAVLGWYGWPTVLLGTFAGFLFGALYGGALVVVRRAGRKTAIAFGPFLIAGAFVGLLVGAYTA
ncbi:prepilin peptidase [Streptomyces sp. NPDC056660]|uniref:prepilin peptidase n=1 Tax=Streptomyces sp. NPDC056660 TaxID=3345897 RepID=UPI003699FB9A